MLYIITKYNHETRHINILHVQADDYADSVHICIDHILDDIKEYYKEDGDQIIINNNKNISVYRRGVWSKYHLYDYIIHEYDDDKSDDPKE